MTAYPTPNPSRGRLPAAVLSGLPGPIAKPIRGLAFCHLDIRPVDLRCLKVASEPSRPKYKPIFRAEPVSGAVRGPNSGISCQSKVATDFIRAATVVAFAGPDRRACPSQRGKNAHRAPRGSSVCDLPRIAASTARTFADARRVCSFRRFRDTPGLLPGHLPPTPSGAPTAQLRVELRGKSPTRRALGNRVGDRSRYAATIARTSTIVGARGHFSMLRRCAAVPEPNSEARSVASSPRRSREARCHEPPGFAHEPAMKDTALLLLWARGEWLQARPDSTSLCCSRLPPPRSWRPHETE